MQHNQDVWSKRLWTYHCGLYLMSMVLDGLLSFVQWWQRVWVHALGCVTTGYFFPRLNVVIWMTKWGSNRFFYFFSSIFKSENRLHCLRGVELHPLLINHSFCCFLWNRYQSKPGTKSYFKQLAIHKDIYKENKFLVACYATTPQFVVWSVGRSPFYFFGVL